jgi:hypothetical protein
MRQRLGPGMKRGWQPSPVRAARRVAQMNAARRARKAERVAIFWDLVEERGLGLEQLTTRVRRDLVGLAKWIQQAILDQEDTRTRAQSATVSVAGDATVHSAPVRTGYRAAADGTGGERNARARALRGRPEVG